MKSELIRAAFMLSLIFEALGCGQTATGPNPPRANVSGRVTLDDQPAPAGTIVFVPVAVGQLQSQGLIREDGTFEIAEANGPSPGEYKVEIQCAKKTGRRVQSLASSDGTGLIDERVPVIPAKYNTATTLRQVIATGENRLTFSLQSDRPAKP